MTIGEPSGTGGGAGGFAITRSSSGWRLIAGRWRRVGCDIDDCDRSRRRGRGVVGGRGRVTETSGVEVIVVGDRTPVLVATGASCPPHPDASATTSTTGAAKRDRGRKVLWRRWILDEFGFMGPPRADDGRGVDAGGHRSFRRSAEPCRASRRRTAGLVGRSRPEALGARTRQASVRSSRSSSSSIASMRTSTIGWPS